MNLQDALEVFKQQGNYSVGVQYGEDIGCDDLHVPQNKRNLIIWMSPVGYLGEVRKLVRTNLDELQKFDFNAVAKIVSNPPKPEEIGDNGVYVWGTPQSIKRYVASLEEGKE